MVRRASLLLFLFLTALLWSSPAQGVLDEADKLLQKKDSVSITKALNSYKSAYINALLDGDTQTAKKARNGIITSAGMLGIDSSEYGDFEEEAGINKKNEPKNQTTIGDLPRILDYRANKNQIYLVLSKKIDLAEVNTFSLQDKKIKKVIFDIPAVFNKELCHIKTNFFKDVRIAQNTPDTVRVVMEKGIDFEAEAAILADKLILTAFTRPVGSPSQKSNILPVAPKPKPQPVVKNIPSQIKKTKTIFIDAGHGGRDGGAVGYKKMAEKDIVVAISRHVVAELKKRGYRIQTSRTTDVFIPLRDRTQQANQHNADLFVSIHANSVPGRIDVAGIETYFLSPARSERAKKVAAQENIADLKEMSNLSQETFLSFLNREKVTMSNKFAIDIQKNILANLKRNYRDVVDNGVREGPFWVLVGAQMPAVLLEVGYITNPTEAKRMKTKRYQQLIAKGIADGIDSFFYYN